MSNILQLLTFCTHADCIITFLLCRSKMNSFHELAYMETSCMVLKLKEEIDALTKTKAHIQDEMNKKIKDIDHKIAIKMELQAQISARNICYLCVIEKTKGNGYYSPKKCGINVITPTKAASTMTGNISVCVSRCFCIFSISFIFNISASTNRCG